MAEVDDPLILAGYLGGVVLNLVLAVQMVMFWNNTPKTKVVKKQVKKGKKRA